ncbi:MAG: tetratricopeptide repeat protein [Cyanobacteria bacterium J06635_1]
MAVPDIYIPRTVAERFLEDLAASFELPAKRPVVFHVWGLGGVGKSTVLARAMANHRQHYPNIATIAEVKFGDTANANTPLGVMKVLYGQLAAMTNEADENEFYKLEQRYNSTLETLKTEAESGTGKADDKQIDQLKKFSTLALQGISAMLPGGSLVGAGLSLAAPHIGDAAELSASMLDEVKGIIHRHKATRDDRELQALMLNPLLELTKAFSKCLQAKAAAQPILLVLDFYEKVPPEVDQWLCKLLLGNTDLQAHPIRMVTAGRKRLLNKEHWSERNQNDQAVYEQELERFEEPQSQQYLAEVGITDDDRVRQIIAATRGLPYYLNWVREEYRRGEEPDFTEGVQAVKQLLLRQFSIHEIQLVQIVACCRSFDGDLIKYLTRCEALEIPLQEKETAKGRFRWLLDLPFSQRTDAGYRLDDVARDVLRQAFYEESQKQFRMTHQRLADHYGGLADEEVWKDAHISEKYDSEDWRSYQSEALYHQLFAQPQQAEVMVIARLLESIYLGHLELVQQPLQAVAAEYQEDRHPLIKKGLQTSLQQLSPMVETGILLKFGEDLSQLFEQEDLKRLKQQIEVVIKTSLGLCWKRTEKLNGLAKFVAYFYQSKYGAEGSRESYLLKAQIQANELVAVDAPKFSVNLLTFDLGNSLDNLGRDEDAISAYEAALAIKPDYPAALYNKGISLAKLGRDEDAITAYEAALAIKPDKHEALYRKGLSLFFLERYQETVLTFDEAASYVSPMPEVLLIKAFALIKLKKYDQVLLSCAEILQAKPDNDYAWSAQGYAHLKLEQLSDAKESLDKALELSSENTAALESMALYWLLNDNSNHALDHLEKSIRLDPERKAEIADDEDFVPLRNDPRFQSLIAIDPTNL